MEKNGTRRVPGTLPPKAVSFLLGVQRTKLYDELRAGVVPHVEREITGDSYEIPTLWVLERWAAALEREVSLEELAAFLPEELLA